MNSTEIQKIFLKEKKSKKEKNITLLKLKKERSNHKSKTRTLNQKKNIKKKLILKNNKKKRETHSDEISLETNSTIISLDEETNIQNEDMMQYLNEIELVLKDIYLKGFNLKIFDNLKTENDSQILEKKENIKFSTENLKKHINSISYSQKINLVLDIDETLVFSKLEKEFKKGEEINDVFEDSPKNDIYYIKIDSINKTCIFSVQVRKNMAYFFKELSPYCNFYINTMGSYLYVCQIINILHKNYGLRLSSVNENNIIYTSPTEKKSLPNEITKTDNFLILDDNICAWDISYIPSIIPIQKFRGMFDKNNEFKNIFYQYYLFTNKIYCYDEIKRPFLDKYSKIPYCVEITKDDNSQLYSICDIIKKSYLLSKLIDIPIRHSLHFIQNTILKECLIYYDGYDKDYIFEIINLLGGTITKNMNDATHAILNRNISNEIKNETECNNKYSLDVKWIFDCFFNYKKCNEYSSEYKLE